MYLAYFIVWALLIAYIPWRTLPWFDALAEKKHYSPPIGYLLWCAFLMSLMLSFYYVTSFDSSYGVSQLHTLALIGMIVIAGFGLFQGGKLLLRSLYAKQWLSPANKILQYVIEMMLIALGVATIYFTLAHTV